MRAALIIAGVLVVLAALGRAIWIESCIVARAYELRELREREGQDRNLERRLDADVAEAATLEALIKTAKALKVQEILNQQKGPLIVIPQVSETAVEEQ